LFISFNSAKILYLVERYCSIQIKITFAPQLKKNSKPEMKKILSFVVIAGFAALISCGPSAEEKAAAEKSRQDSIQAAMDKMAADSIAAVQAEAEKMMQDSLAAVAAQATADSIAKAEAKATKKPVSKPKTPEQKKEEQVKKVSGGRGH